MMQYNLDKQQARRFLLLKHGLLGDHRFVGKTGAYEYVRQAGCIQYDPVDACGRNADLTLQSRVKNFTKQTLYDLLYEDRLLLDFPDKNLSIMPTEDWPYFERYRQAARENSFSFDGLAELEREAKAYMAEHPFVNSDTLPIDGKIIWHSAIHWSGNRYDESNAARSVLEQLYSNGDCIIHHKLGTRKFYDLASKHLPSELLHAVDPLPDEFEHHKWRVLRRIGAVGLLWNRPSDAWLNISGLSTAERQAAFQALLGEEKITAIKVEGISSTLYCRSEDRALLDEAMSAESYTARCELIAPLDCLMWDRKLIRALFDFDYAWEIYTPAAKRKYAYYVLPIIFGERFIGRVEAINDRKTQTLIVKNVWLEDGIKPTKLLQTKLQSCFKRFAKFNDCSTVTDLSELF